MDPLYEWSTANQMGLPLLQHALPLCPPSSPRSHRARVRFVVFFFLFLLPLPRKRLRIRCAARLSNQEILVTLPLPQLRKLDGHAHFR